MVNGTLVLISLIIMVHLDLFGDILIDSHIMVVEYNLIQNNYIVI